MNTVWANVVRALPAYLDPEDALRLSASSRNFGHSIAEQLTAGRRSLGRGWLLATVQQTAHNKPGKLAAAEASYIDKSCAVIRWLLATSAVPAASLAEDSMQYLNIPNVPLDVCQMLVAAGVCVSYQLVVEAARQHTEGLHQWIKACELQGVATDLMPYTRAVCCSSDEASVDPFETADNLAGHLHLAINALSGNSSASQQAAATSNLYNLLHWTLAQNSLHQWTAATILQLMQSAVYVLATRGLSIGVMEDSSCMKYFCDMLKHVSDPENVTPEAIFGLLQIAFQHDLNSYYTLDLLRVPVLQHLAADGVASLIILKLRSTVAQGCFSSGVGAIVLHLFCLPALQDMSPDACAEAFSTLLAVAESDPHMVQAWVRPASLEKDPTGLIPPFLLGNLMMIPGVQLLSASQVRDLLQRALSAGVQARVVPMLCSLPAAMDMSAGDLDQLMQKAVALGPSGVDTIAFLQQVSQGVHVDWSRCALR